jgi:DNA-binding NarL/FixJ family response regulator
MMVFARNPAPKRIGLVADEPIRLAGLSSIFEQPIQEDKPSLLPVPGTLEELLAEPSLEYLVVDLSSASGNLDTLNRIRGRRPNLRLIVIGPEGNDELVMDSIIAGARGYLELTAGPDRLLKVSDTSLISTGPHLTDREREVLEHILMARSNREIARQLGIEERTVKAHVGRLMRKTGSDNRIELSMRALHLPPVPHGKAGQGGKGKPPSQKFTQE